MVNVIDQDERRDVLAGAVWRLIRAHGFGGASVRAVALEAGVSSGSVRHTFPTQAQLHAFAMQTLTERITARVRTHRGITDPAARATAMVCELMPLTDENEDELRAWLEFVAASHADTELAAIAHTTFVATRAFLANVVIELIDADVVPRHVDVERAVTELNALIDGLTLELVRRPQIVERANARALVAFRLTHLAADEEGRS